MTFLKLLLLILLASLLTDAKPSGFSGCPSLEVPPYSERLCSENEPGILSCTFTCQNNWTSLVGPSVVKCSLETGQHFPDVLPVCEVDYMMCGNVAIGQPECKEITKDAWKQASQYREYIPQDIRAEMEELEREFLATTLLRRAGSKFKCRSSMCNQKCVSLAYRKLARICSRCKQKKKIKCSKTGSLFGR